jgi:putative tryptophan/tyrosine transport system substrate-binding protein
MTEPPLPFSRLLSRHTRRREFIGLVSGVATWQFAAGAQQPNVVRRLSWLGVNPPSDPFLRHQLTELTKALERLGWTESRDLRIDYLAYGGNSDRARTFAKEFIRLAPDVIIVVGSPGVAVLQQEIQNIPIVFMGATDPVGQGPRWGASRTAA